MHAASGSGFGCKYNKSVGVFSHIEGGFLSEQTTLTIESPFKVCYFFFEVDRGNRSFFPKRVNREISFDSLR